MRIAVAAHAGTRVGGVEVYLASAIPALVSAGHAVACWFEETGPGREPILGPNGHTPIWTASDRPADAFEELRAWRPDVVYTHGLRDVEHERALLGVAPSVFFAHSHVGTCISGTKMHQQPSARACTHRLGPECLLRYYPRRCGGWSPITMARQYRLQRARLDLLGDYTSVLVASQYMADEYARHGVGVHVVPYPIESQQPAAGVRQPSASWHLLFLGRLEALKGAYVALESAARVSAIGRRPVELQMSGEGSARAALEVRAAELTIRFSKLRVTFTGWLDERQAAQALDRSDLLLVPSCWPEPFGIVGVEAALRGVPAVAFAIGGIPEWLSDGVTGRLVPADPPDVDRFADAVVACLADEDGLRRMSERSRAAANRFHVAAHVARLEQVFAGAVAASFEGAPI